MKPGIEGENERIFSSMSNTIIISPTFGIFTVKINVSISKWKLILYVLGMEYNKQNRLWESCLLFKDMLMGSSLSSP